jgi:hypothetical protein
MCDRHRALLLAIPLSVSLCAATARADLFDVTEGAVVVDHSPIGGGEVAEEMLGLVPETGPEHGTLIFGDGQPAGTVHYAEWEMPEDVTVGRIRLYAQGDSCTGTRRTFNRFRLLAMVGGGMQTLVDEPLDVPYKYVTNCSMVLAMGTPITTATRFRAEFTQATEGSYPGPRVIELDGLVPAVCGDANGDGSFTATDALISLRAAVGSVYCDGCVCDVNGDDEKTSSDALRLLSYAVGGPVELVCPDCPLSEGVALRAGG